MVKRFYIAKYKVKIKAVADVAKRMRDWVESGGKDDDPYMQGQLDYAKKESMIRGKSKWIRN